MVVALAALALPLLVLAPAAMNVLPANQKDAVKNGRRLQLESKGAMLDVATRGMVVGEECSVDTAAKACYPVMPAVDAPLIKDADGTVLESANSHAYLLHYHGLAMCAARSCPASPLVPCLPARALPPRSCLAALSPYSLTPPCP